MNPMLPTGDDRDVLRSFARVPLTTKEREVVGEGGGATTPAVVHATHPEVVPRDTRLSTINGFEVSPRMAQTLGAPRLVLTVSRTAIGRRPADSGFPGTRLPAQARAVRRHQPRIGDRDHSPLPAPGLTCV